MLQGWMPALPPVRRLKPHRPNGLRGCSFSHSAHRVLQLHTGIPPHGNRIAFVNAYSSCIHAFGYSFIHAFIHPCVHSSIHLFIHASMHAFIHPCVHSSLHPCIQQFIDPCIYPSMHPAIHTSILPCIHPSTHPYIHPSMHPSVHSSRRANNSSKMTCRSVEMHLWARQKHSVISGN